MASATNLQDYLVASGELRGVQPGRGLDVLEVSVSGLIRLGPWSTTFEVLDMDPPGGSLFDETCRDGVKGVSRSSFQLPLSLSFSMSRRVQSLLDFSGVFSRGVSTCGGLRLRRCNYRLEWLLVEDDTLYLEAVESLNSFFGLERTINWIIITLCKVLDGLFPIEQSSQTCDKSLIAGCAVLDGED
jgi:hypothetical protein